MRNDGGEERIYSIIAFYCALAVNLTVVIQFLETLNGSVEYRVKHSSVLFRQEYAVDFFDLVHREDGIFFYFGEQVVEFVGVGFAVKICRLVVFLESFGYELRIACEVEDEGISFLRVATIEALKRLHRFNVAQNLIDIHSME